MSRPLDRAAVSELVDRFYEAVRRDALLGPVFGGAIAPHEWEHHKARMVAFWCTAMLGTREFRGNVFERHRVLPGIAPAHFTRWLALFHETAAGMFDPPQAASLVDAARGLARGMQIGLFGRPAS